MKKYLTQTEVGKVLRVSVCSVARLRRQGLLPYVPGRPVLVPEDGLENYLKQKETRKCIPNASKTRNCGETPERVIMKSVGLNAGETEHIERERIRAALKIKALRKV